MKMCIQVFPEKNFNHPKDIFKRSKWQKIAFFHAQLTMKVAWGIIHPRLVTTRHFLFSLGVQNFLSIVQISWTRSGFYWNSWIYEFKKLWMVRYSLSSLHTSMALRFISEWGVSHPRLVTTWVVKNNPILSLKIRLFCHFCCFFMSF